MVESYRNLEGHICHRTLLQVGFLPGVSMERLNKVLAHLNVRNQQQRPSFEESDPVARQLVEELWQRMVEEKRIDLKWAEKAARMIDTQDHEA